MNEIYRFSPQYGVFNVFYKFRSSKKVMGRTFYLVDGEVRFKPVKNAVRVGIALSDVNNHHFSASINVFNISKK